MRDWVEQLVVQGFIRKTGEYDVLKLTAPGREVLRGRAIPRLLRPSGKKAGKARAAVDGWQDVDIELFEELRALRRRIARRQEVPAYVVFGDASLRDMARLKPETEEEFLQVLGVGERKCEQYARDFLDAIARWRDPRAV